MTDGHPTTESDYTTVPISPELRDRIRVAKAKTGQSYEAFLRENLSLSE